MTPYEFWYEDARLLVCFGKAYNNRLNRTAWLHGLYNETAVSAAVNNIMPTAIARGLSGKRGRAIKYPVEPIEPSRAVQDMRTRAANADPNVQSGVAAWAARIKQLKGMEG